MMQFQLVITLYLIPDIFDILSGDSGINPVQLTEFFERKRGGGQIEQQQQMATTLRSGEE